jgi:hypothetical protein
MAHARNLHVAGQRQDEALALMEDRGRQIVACPVHRPERYPEGMIASFSLFLFFFNDTTYKRNGNSFMSPFYTRANDGKETHLEMSDKCQVSVVEKRDISRYSLSM